MDDIEKYKKKLQVSERKIEILESLFENQTRELYISNKGLEQQNKELQHFAYVLSHDLKAPIRAISSLSHFIKDDIKVGNISEANDKLETLQSRIERMDKLLNGVVIYSKIGMSKVKKEDIDMNTLISEVIDNQNATDNFKFKIMSHLPTIYDVKSLIIQLFSNLIGNAVKFNDKEQGEVIIDYKDINNKHEFSIKDNGPGISQEFHEKIFVVFQTLNSRDSIEATGIGLSIVKKIIDKLKGNIKLESIENKGVKFIISLPKIEKNS